MQVIDNLKVLLYNELYTNSQQFIRHVNNLNKFNLLKYLNLGFNKQEFKVIFIWLWILLEVSNQESMQILLLNLQNSTLNLFYNYNNFFYNKLLNLNNTNNKIVVESIKFKFFLSSWTV